MIKNVVFDVGKVLVEFDWQGYLEALGFSPEIYEKVADATVRSELWNEFDRSKMSDEEILEGFLAGAPECKEEILRFWDNIGSCIKCYDYAASWIQALQEKGYGVYLLSNYPRRIYFQSIHELSFVELVDGAVFSFEVQATKPEPGIYEALLEKYQLQPTECVFVDDLRTNIIAANHLGMATIHFHTKSQAEEELRSLGVEC
ncbi:MAG: HAD family phosphatase [Lachnospiraceae bacterium]|jgi:putative hydrolase of the HAD superfamily|nr:HAD family phosphatase [Lachnospiraceae bacterium]